MNDITTCALCCGTGRERTPGGESTCSICGGAGGWRYDPDGRAVRPKEECATCGGTGQDLGARVYRACDFPPCPVCEGVGAFPALVIPHAGALIPATPPP